MAWCDLLRNIPITEVARLHTEPLTSDESSDDGAAEPELPVFTLKQIEAYLIPHPRTVSEPSGEFRQVAQLLSEQITQKHCNICHKAGGGHYRASGHHKKVSLWVGARLKTCDTVLIAKVYCEPCNLALDSPDQHYGSESHRRCAELYCGRCQINVSCAQAMQKHVHSKKHVTRALNESKATLYVPSCEVDVPVLNSNDSMDYQPEVKSDNLAARLSKLLEADKCLICKVVNKAHASSKQHIPNVLAWIQANDTQQEFYPNNVGCVFCAACNLVLADADEGSAHYSQDKHEQNAAKYCNLCQRRLKNATNHQNSKRHIKSIARQKQMPSSKIKSGNTKSTESISNSDGMQAETHLELDTQFELEEEILNSENILHEQILRQLELIADKVLLFRTISAGRALTHLKRLNAELSSIPKVKPVDSLPPKPCTLTKRMQIQRETDRTIALLAERNRPGRLTVNVVFNFVYNLMTLLVAKPGHCDWRQIFTADKEFLNCQQESLNICLCILEGVALRDEAFALSIVQQFNAHLECLIERQRSEDVAEVMLGVSYLPDLEQTFIR